MRMRTLDANSNVPLYSQLYDVILDQIEQGNYRPGDKIPSEDNLCKTFGISRVTVRNAIQHLVEDEILVRIHGKGTYVADVFAPRVFYSGSFTETCMRIGAKPTTKIISCAVEPAGRRIAERLRISEGQDMIRIQRLRLVNSSSCILETDFLSIDHSYLLDMNLEGVSLLGSLREHIGNPGLRYEDFFDVLQASEEIATNLDCDAGMPLLRVNQTILTEAEQILYYNEQLIRTDRYRYAVRSFSS